MSLQNLSSGFQTRSNTNQAVQAQEMARGLQFGIYEVEGLYYLCSENKGADQPRSYCAADLQLLYSHMQKADFLMIWIVSSFLLCSTLKYLLFAFKY